MSSYNNKRCVFTWNTTRFKDPKGYFSAMNEKGAQNVPNVKPGILLCHPWFSEFEGKDVFVKEAESDHSTWRSPDSPAPAWAAGRDGRKDRPAEQE